MNDLGKPIDKERCDDCITVAGQSYCTMNCGPIMKKLVVDVRSPKAKKAVGA